MFDALAFQLAKPQVWVGLAVSVLVGYALYRLGLTLLRSFGHLLPPRVRAALGALWVLAVTVGWLGIATHIIYLPQVPFFFEFGSDLMQGFRNSAGQVIVVVALSLIGWGLIGAATRRIVVEDDFNRRTVRVQTLKGVVDSTLKVALVVVSAIAILQTLGVNATSLLAGVSILGVAVGFGAQSLVRDVFTGFFILLEDQYGVGDVITVGSGPLTGNVEKLNLRTTVLRALDGTVHIIPNGQIQTVSVSSKDWSRVVATVDVTYNADLNEALRVLEAVSQELYADPDWQDYFLAEPEIQGVTQLAPDGVTLRALFKVQPKSQFALGREFNRRIKIAMDQARIEIPGPQRNVNFGSGPLEIRVAQGDAPGAPDPKIAAQERTRSPLPPSFTRDEEDER